MLRERFVEKLQSRGPKNYSHAAPARQHAPAPEWRRPRRQRHTTSPSPAPRRAQASKCAVTRCLCAPPLWTLFPGKVSTLLA